jgi:hypothetical protein
MKISADSKGNILAFGDEITGTDYTGTVPADFLTTFSLGKYTLVNGVVTAVSGWVAPVVAAPIV